MSGYPTWRDRQLGAVLPLYGLSTGLDESTLTGRGHNKCRIHHQRIELENVKNWVATYQTRFLNMNPPTDNPKCSEMSELADLKIFANCPIPCLHDC